MVARLTCTFGSNVAEATFITNGGTADGAFGGVTASSASKGDGTFIANGSTVSGAQGANVFFFGVSSEVPP